MRLTVSEVHKGESTELLFVARGAGGKLLGGFWTDGRGRYEHGSASGDCEMSVVARGAQIVVTRTCTNVFSNMCTWEDRTETDTLSIEGGALAVTSVTEPEPPTATMCGE